jgi:hypothetical protein
VDTTKLRDAYAALLDAAGRVATAGETCPAPPAGEWDADQILAHVSIVTAVTIGAACAVASGANTTYENRTALDTWTLHRITERAEGNAGLRDRIRGQADALCALGERSLRDAELDTQVPTLLLSNGTVLVDDVLPLRDLITGLADVELPNHTQQLLALLSG